MKNNYFRLKQFTVHQDKCAMKVTTDACLFGAWCAQHLQNKRTLLGLDIGTGSGLLSLQVAQKNDVLIHAIEINKDAAEQAGKNVADSVFRNRIRVINADATNFGFTERYGFIISNPPFYKNDLQSASAPRNLAHHTGLPLETLLNLIAMNLQADGEFYILLPYKRIREAELCVADGNLVLHEKCIVAPTPMHRPQRVMLKGGFTPGALQERIVTIKNEDDSYSPEFVSLLKDYYLYL